MENNFSNQIFSFLKDYLTPLKTPFETKEGTLYFFKEELGWNMINILVDTDSLFEANKSIPCIIEGLSTPVSEDSIIDFVKKIAESDFSKIFYHLQKIKDVAIIPSI